MTATAAAPPAPAAAPPTPGAEAAGSMRPARRSWLDRQPLALLLDLNQVAFAAAFVLYLLTILLEPRLGEEAPTVMDPGNLLWLTVITGTVFILTRWMQAQQRDRLGRRTEWLLLVSICIGAWAFLWQNARDTPIVVYPMAAFTAFLVGFAGYSYLGPGSARVAQADAVDEAVARRREILAALPEWERVRPPAGAGRAAAAYLPVVVEDPELLECPRCQLRARLPPQTPRRLRCPRCRVVVAPQVSP